MSEPPLPPPGQEPQPPYGQQPPGQPPYQPYGQPPPPGYYPPPPPAKKSNTALIVLAVIGGLILLFCGGCLAVGTIFVNEVDDAIEESTADDDEPGHVDNPLEITPGEAFEVTGMEYAAGWAVRADDLGDLEVSRLRVTNNRAEDDEVIAEIKLWRGREILAQAECTTDEIAVGTQVTVDCFSADRFPANYDTVTINDTF